ncbi:hypothetical protein Taro_014340 [Colocasia esculenta]|uniref:DUF8040 domain-containing protein n=1 Tax=Colocasia esculenta TaxID=4460 RepID=A0A843UHY4_COLES|nr:hypothetical protein [Colocasia esculenta]
MDHRLRAMVCMAWGSEIWSGSGFLEQHREGHLAQPQPPPAVLVEHPHVSAHHLAEPAHAGAEHQLLLNVAGPGLPATPPVATYLLPVASSTSPSFHSVDCTQMVAAANSTLRSVDSRTAVSFGLTGRKVSGSPLATSRPSWATFRGQVLLRPARVRPPPLPRMTGRIGLPATSWTAGGPVDLAAAEARAEESKRRVRKRRTGFSIAADRDEQRGLEAVVASTRIFVYRGQVYWKVPRLCHRQCRKPSNVEFKKFLDKPFPYKRELDILCGKAAIGYPGAQFKGFTSLEEGQHAYNGMLRRATSSQVHSQASYAHRELPASPKMRQASYAHHEPTIPSRTGQPPHGPFMDSDALIRHFLCEENALFLAIDEAIADEVLNDYDMQSVPRPMHTSCHTGHIWVHEILAGHEERSYTMFRMHPVTFLKLRDTLVERELIRDSRYVTATEQLGMFLYAMGHGVAMGAMREHFQHSSETISKVIHQVTKAVASL